MILGGFDLANHKNQSLGSLTISKVSEPSRLVLVVREIEAAEDHEEAAVVREPEHAGDRRSIERQAVRRASDAPRSRRRDRNRNR